MKSDIRRDQETYRNLRSNWVDGPATSHRQAPELERFGHDRASGLGMTVLISTQVEHHGAEAEHQRRQQIRQPEADVLLGIDHTNLSGEGTDVDHHIEVHEDAGHGHRRVHKYAFALVVGDDSHSCVLVLLGDEW